MSIKLLLIDDRKIFTQNFEKYINSKHRNHISLYLFSSVEKYNEFYSKEDILDKDKCFDVLLCSPESHKDILGKDVGVEVILVGNSVPIEYNDYIHVSKYSSADEIIDLVYKSHIEKSNKVINFSGSSSTSFIMIYSPLGGSGKTSVAIMMANALSNLGKKVLYIPLGLDALYFRENDYDIRYIFATDINPATIKFEINKIKFPYYNDKFDIVSGFNNFSDYYGLNSEMWANFIEISKKSLDYDYVLIDTMDVCHDITFDLFKYCDNIFFIVNSGNIESEKFNLFMQSINKDSIFTDFDKSFLIKNNRTPLKSSHNIELEGNFVASLTLDYDSNLKYLSPKGMVLYNNNSVLVEVFENFCSQYF